MTTSSNINLASEGIDANLQSQIAQAVSGGLGEMSLRDLLGMTLTLTQDAERAAYLSAHPQDKGNGSYNRTLQLGSMPLSVEVPRVRSGEFRPSLLPEKYQRGYPEESKQLLMGLLSSCRSISAVKASLQKMGMSSSESDLDAVAAEFVELLKLRNTSPISPDLIALFVDGKYVEIRDEGRIVPACIYVVCGMGRDGKKRILCCQCLVGRESLDHWKTILKSLLERGLRRVLIVIHDDFSGLRNVSQSLFPKSDIQLCIVHMQRNAKSHLPKDDYAEFMARIKTIKFSWDMERACSDFDALCDAYAEKAPHFISEIRKKRNHYLHFLKYPSAIRRTFSTTNAVEAVNGQLERMRRNNGGYFHSQHILELKLGMTIDFLEQGKWNKPAASTRAAIHELNTLFEHRFEDELNFAQTQNY